MQVMVICAKPQVQDYFRLWLQQYNLKKVISVGSAEGAIELLRQNPDIDLIICDEQLPKLKGSELCLLLKQNNTSNAFVLCGESLAESELGVPTVAGPLSPNMQDELLGFIKSLTHIQKTEAESALSYTPIKASTLLTMGTLPCDVFVRLNENRYLKVRRKDSVFEAEDFEKYSNKNENPLMIPSQDLRSVLTRLLEILGQLDQLDDRDLIEQMESLITSSKESELKQELIQMTEGLKKFEGDQLKSQDLLELNIQQQKLLNKSMKKLGVTPELHKMIQISVKTAMTSLEQAPQLQELFELTKEGQQDYLASHPVLLAHVACLIAHRLGWTSKILFYQICISAFMHDLYIPDQELAKIRNKEELDQRIKSEEEKSMILTHPEKAVESAHRLKLLPVGFERVILEHHEFPDAKGFPQGLRCEQLHPVSCVFIFAHELVTYLMDHADNNNAIENFYRTQSKNFRHGYFKKIFQTMAGYSPEVGKIKVREN